MAMKPRRFNGGGAVSGSEGSRVNIGAGASPGSTRGAPDSDMGPRIKEANKKKPLSGNFNRTEGPEPKKPEQKMRGGGMVKKK